MPASGRAFVPRHCGQTVRGPCVPPARNEATYLIQIMAPRVIEGAD